jgi:hypothetical protein
MRRDVVFRIDCESRGMLITDTNVVFRIDCESRHCAVSPAADCGRDIHPSVREKQGDYANNVLPEETPSGVRLTRFHVTPPSVDLKIPPMLFEQPYAFHPAKGAIGAVAEKPASCNSLQHAGTVQFRGWFLTFPAVVCPVRARDHQVDSFVVERIVRFADALIGAAGRSIDLRRTLHFQSLVRSSANSMKRQSFKVNAVRHAASFLACFGITMEIVGHRPADSEH